MDLIKNLICLAIVSCLLSACNTNTSTLKIVLGEKQSAKEASKIKIFFDNSASMYGFIGRDNGNNAEFKDQVPALLSRIENGKSIQVYLLSDTLERYRPKKGMDLIKSFTENMINYTWQNKLRESTPINEMFETAFKNIKDGEIGIIISETQMSEPSAGYKNRDISRLKGTTKLIFERYKNKGYGVSIFGFQSHFRGYYYPALGSKVRCCDDDVLRPYYIWVIAKKEYLPSFINHLQKQNIQPKEALHFGWNYPPPSFEVLKELAKEGSWVSYQTDSIEDISKGERTTFTIALDLGGYPEFIKQVGFLQENLSFSSDIQLDTSAIKITTKQTLAGEDARLSGKYTHFIALSFNGGNVTQVNNTLTIKLIKKQKEWYRHWSTENDRNINTQKNSGKTYAFAALIQSIQEVYREDKNYF